MTILNNVYLNEVVWLAEQGIPVHPIPLGQKFTNQKGWQVAPILTEEEVKAYLPDWEKHNYGLGIRTGFPLTGGGFLGVIDVDPHAGELTPEVRAELHQALLSLGLSPTVPNVITGRCDDSCHYYIHFSDIGSVNKAALKLSESKHKNTDGKPYWIIELLGKGKQVVSPPTIHPKTGLSYRRVSHNIMDAPAELLKRLTEQQVHTQGAQAKHTDPIIDSLANDQVLASMKEALSFINPNCDYPLWRDVLWAIRDHQIHAGKEIAKEWSKQSQEKFDENAFESTWESFDPNGGIHAATLYTMRNRRGWKGETYHSTALKNVTVSE
ncbi:bifunctional DNA primase/polymerase [Budvicia aquatica]|uniref:Bifunctional DNA primase/polymerase, N-terminal n=1 Tax=Budvicia aquatica TaxID=82979 RepID=A0A484ZI94_9GAMM|nr:bifunctional DNA primase/polymerase [Budvicia aquatica]VFS48210.1 Bifunctional DNA primase/polymerase, N-terminal [Budvicia aquatica]